MFKPLKRRQHSTTAQARSEDDRALDTGSLRVSGESRRSPAPRRRGLINALKVLPIAWREFKHTALTKAFIVGTIVFPLIIWGGMILVPLLVTTTTPPLTGTLALIDETGEAVEHVIVEFDRERQRTGGALGGDVAQILDDVANGLPTAMPGLARVEVDLELVDDSSDLDRLLESARAGDLLGVAVIRSIGRPEEEGVTLYLPTHLNPDHADSIRNVLASAMVRARAASELPGLDVDEVRAMLRSPRIDLRRLTPEGEAAGGFELQRALPIIFMILVWIASFASGNYLLTTTIEEKSNKVMEVLLSAVSPWQLMSGKIFGQALVGLFTIAVYAALGAAILWRFAMMDLIAPSQILYMAVYFLMAYLMIASMMAAIGSAVSDLQEAHALITPTMLILFLPWLLFIPVSRDPNGALATITSFIPPLTPFVMIMRVTAPEGVATWQIIASMAVGALGVVGMMWMAAKIFRVGVLMYGKPPSPLELLRWLRYS